jgi:hypothetical protein
MLIEGLGVGVNEIVADGVNDTDGVNDDDIDAVNDGVTVNALVEVNDGVLVSVGVIVEVFVGVCVYDGVTVFAGVSDGVNEIVLVGVCEILTVCDKLCVGFGVEYMYSGTFAEADGVGENTGAKLLNGSIKDCNIGLVFLDI